MTRFKPKKSIKKKTLSKSAGNIDKLIALGKRAYDRQDWAEAARHYVAAWNLAPEDKDLLVIVSFLMVQLGAREQALGVLQKALEVNGPTAEVLGIMGQMANQMQIYDVAEKMYRIFIEAYPTNVSAYNGLANALGGTDRYDESISFLQEAIPLFPESADLWNTLATHVSNRDGAMAARPFYLEAARLAPDDFRIANNLSLNYEATGEQEEAEHYLRRALELKPDDVEPKMGLALIELAKGNLKEGWANYEARLDHKRKKSPIFTHKLPRWEGEDLSDKALLVCAEQGLGDEVLFAMTFHELAERCHSLFVGCDARLVPAIQRTFPDAVVAASKTINQTGYLYRAFPEIEQRMKTGDIAIDRYIEVGSTPQYLWQEKADIPQFKRGFLKPDPARASAYRDWLESLGPGLKVGISWRSGLLSAHRRQLYSQLDDWAPVFELDGVDLINVQYGDVSAEIEDFTQRTGHRVHFVPELDLKNDIEGNFALMDQLDLVISPASAPSMLSAAVGCPTWWLIHQMPWWAFGYDKCHWHPHSEIFITGPKRDWAALLHGVAAKLRDFTPRR